MFWEWICATTEVLFIFGQIAVIFGLPALTLYHFIKDVLFGVKDIKEDKCQCGRSFSDGNSVLKENNKYFGDPTYSYMVGNPSHKRYSI